MPSTSWSVDGVESLRRADPDDQRPARDTLQRWVADVREDRDRARKPAAAAVERDERRFGAAGEDDVESGSPGGKDRTQRHLRDVDRDARLPEQAVVDQAETLAVGLGRPGKPAAGLCAPIPPPVAPLRERPFV